MEVRKLKNILGGLEAAQKRIDDSIAGMSGTAHRGHCRRARGAPARHRQRGVPD
ncbi:hypothetical protein HJC10_20710 [Corallococcus exiguus]|uniref:hypothetical protein n=1 Tax=Corallococcus TaxID=83461 RepID=UPI0013153169|nr:MULTISPECIES: hypothetical protein [Corallococcus]NNB85877.1 hypothetical protein [Corallococcus exiguus]NNB93931.1 hypothetical protein [Corallococcus exiguus]NNC05264.1 hypothetical protein [Corallococcus exiguus]NPC48885.1 hypothetical protein [Corallococcus exiguus]